MALFRRDDESKPAQAVPLNTPRPLTASAVKINMKSVAEAEAFRQRQKSQTMTWQSEAWEYYDAIGEIKYAVNLVASIISNIKLYAATYDSPNEVPVPISDSSATSPTLAEAAIRAVDRLDSAFGGQAGLLKDAALNLSISGECYLVQVPERKGQGLPESWDIRSVDEVKVDSDGNYFIQTRREGSTTSAFGAAAQVGRIPIPKGAFMGRIWRSHPRFTDEPDSSMRGVLDLCAELLLLQRSFRALERSRINAGLLFIPDGLSNSSEADPDGTYDDTDNISATPEELQDKFENDLADALITPVEDESSSASVVPLIIRGPADLGDKIRPITFSRPFDDALEKRAQTVLERILQALDVPKDTVTGLANVKYANAVQINESLYKAHIEPMLMLISDALTVSYLHPYLISLGYDPNEVRKTVVWYDPSSVATRNDRAADADSGFEKGALSFDAWRKAHGFNDQDAPTPTEFVLRMLWEKGQLGPEITDALLNTFAPEVMEAARQGQQANSVAPLTPEIQQALGGDSPAEGSSGGEQAPDLAEPGDVEPTPESAPTEPVPADAGEPVGPGQDAPPFPTEEEEDEPNA